MRLPHPFWHVSHAFGGPIGSSTESGTHTALFTTAYGWVLRQDNFLFFSLLALRLGGTVGGGPAQGGYRPLSAMSGRAGGDVSYPPEPTPL
eukprot:6415712-Pyramimonas_sp.AAC.1